jgi:Flp pilus assembly secretin CpaC
MRSSSAYLRNCISMLLLAALTMPASAAPYRTQQFLALPTGHSMVLHVRQIRRVAVGDSGCLGVVAIGASQLIINGKTPCDTSLFVWSANGSRSSYEVMVSDDQLDDVSRSLRSAIPYRGVHVQTFGQGVIVRGSVPDMAAFEELNDLINRFGEFATKNHYTIVNAVTVAHSLQSIRSDFAGVPGVSGLQIEPDGKGNVMVSGSVPNGLVAEQVLHRAETLAGPFLAVDGKVVNRLDVAEQTEIDVKVQVLEVDRTGLSQLGIRLQGATAQPGNSVVLGQPSFPVIEGPAASALGRALNIGSFYRTTFLAPTLDLILQEGHGRVLSQPDLTALPGVQATFLVGGKIPYVYSTGIGQVTVQFEDYGVALNFTPNLLPNGSIDTKLNPDISELDYQNAVTLNGYYFPAFKESKISTELVTKPGQSIILGGLLQRVSQKTISKIPLLSSIPILGKLFQSTYYQTGQTDVVFVMTPKIVNQ